LQQRPKSHGSSSANFRNIPGFTLTIALMNEVQLNNIKDITYNRLGLAGTEVLKCDSLCTKLLESAVNEYIGRIVLLIG
jgi:hypothetical protein